MSIQRGHPLTRRSEVTQHILEVDELVVDGVDIGDRLQALLGTAGVASGVSGGLNEAQVTDLFNSLLGSARVTELFNSLLSTAGVSSGVSGGLSEAQVIDLINAYLTNYVMNNELADTNSELQSVEGWVLSMEGNVSVIEEALRAVQNELAGISGNITTVESNLTAVENDYVTNQNLTSTLSGYVTTAALADTSVGALTARVGVAESWLGTVASQQSAFLPARVTNIEGNYAFLSMSLNNVVNNYAQTSALDSYALTSALDSYVSSSSLSNRLTGYAPITALGSFVTSSQLTSRLADYVTSTHLEEINYMTVAVFDNYRVYVNGQNADFQASLNEVRASMPNYSDDRLKFNEEIINNALDTILQLQPKKYDKSLTLNVEENTEREAGFIAQEVFEIPELKPYVVEGTAEEAWRLNYSCFIPYLVSAVKEQNAIISSLRVRIEALETAATAN